MEWNTGQRPYLGKIYKYLIMIRAPDDPERRLKKQVDVFPHHTLAKMKFEDIRDLILFHLMDGQPRTLNRIGVELWDKTSDITGMTQVEEALWCLVESRKLEHTMATPILFRALGQLRLF